MIYVKNNIALSQGIIGSALLSYYNMRYSPAVVFGIGEGYSYNFNNGIFSNCDDNIITNMCYNLSFFENHFFSEKGESFMSEVEEMLYVKKYPLCILFSNYNINDNNFFEKKVCKKLLIKKKGQERRYFIRNGINQIADVSKDDIIDNIGDDMVDWNVIIPPKKIVNINFAIIKALRSTVNRMNNKDRRKNNSEHNELRKFFENIKHGECDKDFSCLGVIDGTTSKLFAEFLEVASKKLEITEFKSISKNYNELATLWDELGQGISLEIPIKSSLLDKIFDDEAEIIEKMSKIINCFFGNELLVEKIYYDK